MTFYRLAVQSRQSTHWIWKTTPVTSLQAVFQLLRSYSMLPQDAIRVFTASSKAELSEMLNRQNEHTVSGSVTATQFLQERNIAGGDRLQSTSNQRSSIHTNQLATDRNAYATWETHAAAAQSVRQQADIATWAKEIWEKHRAGQANQQETSAFDVPPLHALFTTNGTFANPGQSLQDKKRLEIELGPGGDHDKAYRFALPISLKEQLAWIRMQKQVQAGRLSS